MNKSWDSICAEAYARAEGHQALWGVWRRLDAATIAGRDVARIDADMSQADDAIEISHEGAVVAKLTFATGCFTFRPVASRAGSTSTRSANEAFRLARAHMEALARETPVALTTNLTAAPQF